LQLCWQYGRLTLAELLVATGRFTEAARLLERRWAGSATCGEPVSDVLWTLLRAQAFERVGRRREALQNYSFVADAWQNADPELQPLVRQARDGLARLAKPTARRAAAR
jgi:predicted Zn-dependent protease